MDCAKIRRHWTPTFCRLQLAKQLDSRVDTREVSLTEVGDSVFGFLHQVHKSCERDGEQTNEFLGQLIDLATCANGM